MPHGRRAPSNRLRWARMDVVGSSSQSPPDLPIGFAHRGARAECRDNTMRSFMRAIELGARALESDAWVTADGVVVLDHDGLVRRGVRRVAIAEMPRAALPAHVPTLIELLEASGDDVDLSLDIKDPAAAGPTIAAVEVAGRAERTWLCGTGAPLLDWRARSARMRLVDSTRISRMSEGLRARVERLVDAGVDAVNLRWPDWDPARLAIVHGAGLLAFAWDTQQVATITSMADLGVDGVYSDHVARMVGTLSAFRARRALERPQTGPAGRHDPSVA